MSYENKRSAILAAFVLAALSSASALFAAVIPCRTNDLNPDICINGLTGKVEYSLSAAARPGTMVTVEVCPADFIHYDFTVAKADEALKETNIIVGIEPPKATAGPATLNLAPQETNDLILARRS